MPQKKNQPSPLEWHIMTVVWGIGKAVTVREVLNSAYPKGEKAYTTVQTVMNNLVAKGFLKKEKIGLVNFYQPLKERNKILKNELKNFANKTFGGSLNALANFLIDSGSLTPEEIQNIKHLIDEKQAKRAGK